MTDDLPWEAAFVATGVLLGEPAAAMAGALGEDGRARAEAVVRALASPSREDRARALARVAAEIARAVDATRGP